MWGNLESGDESIRFLAAKSCASLGCELGARLFEDHKCCVHSSLFAFRDVFGALGYGGEDLLQERENIWARVRMRVRVT